MENKGFRITCERVASGVLSCWSDKINCYYDEIRNRFHLVCTHSWGTAQCYWDDNTKEALYQALKKVGAVNIKKSAFTWNYVNLYFTMKKTLQKEV